MRLEEYTTYVDKNEPEESRKNVAIQSIKDELTNDYSRPKYSVEKWDAWPIQNLSSYAYFYCVTVLVPYSEYIDQTFNDPTYGGYIQ